MGHPVVDELESIDPTADAGQGPDSFPVPEDVELVEQLPPPPKAKIQRAEATFARHRWEAELGPESASSG